MTRPAILAAFLAIAACSQTAPPQTDATTLQLPALITTQCHAVDGKADRHCTPGALNPAVTQDTIHQTICIKGWTATVRPPVSYTDALKRKQMLQYGDTGPLAGFEEDHFEPLEAGGSPTDPQNSWPQPRTGLHPAAEKDAMENAVHAAICANRITLKQGQDQILARWSQ